MKNSMTEPDDLLCITNMAYRTAGRLHNTGNTAKVWQHCMVSTICWSIHTGHQAGAQIWQHSNDTNECTKDLIRHVRNGVPPVILPYTTSRYTVSTKHRSTAQTVSTGPGHVTHMPRHTYATSTSSHTTIQHKGNSALNAQTIRQVSYKHGPGKSAYIQGTMCWPSSLVHELKSNGVQGSINDTSAIVHKPQWHTYM